MPRVMRRTPAAEEAMKYGYRGFLQDIVAQAGRNVARMTSGGLGKEELLEMAFAGVGAGTKFPKAAGKLMRLFQKEGLKYDAFTEPLPGMGYHQWTLYGKGPAKGATFGTKTTELGEMQEKITELMRKFRKETVPLKPSVPDPITGKGMTEFRVKPGGRHKWSVESPTQTKADREVVKGRIQPGKWKAGVKKSEVSGYIIEGYNPETKKWLWFNTEDDWLRAEQTVKRAKQWLKKEGK